MKMKELKNCHYSLSFTLFFNILSLSVNPMTIASLTNTGFVKVLLYMLDNLNMLKMFFCSNFKTRQYIDISPRERSELYRTFYPKNSFSFFLSLYFRLVSGCYW